MLQLELKSSICPAVFSVKGQSAVQKRNSAESYTVLAAPTLDSFQKNTIYQFIFHSMCSQKPLKLIFAHIELCMSRVIKEKPKL